MLTSDLFEPSEKRLTVLSFGGGQDSSVLLEKFIREPEFRAKYAPNDFLVVMSCTGDEFNETTHHVKATKERCKTHGIEFVHITSDMGFHSENWKSLTTFYKKNTAIGSRAFKNPCSHNLKLQPIYRFLEHWLHKRYGVQCHQKRGLREFAKTWGKIDMVIGIAKGEEKRIFPAENSPYRWYRESINPVYPLLDMGMDRAACQDYLASVDLGHVIPSNCVRCPYLSLEELEYLRRFYPTKLDSWVRMEWRKLIKHSARNQVIAVDKNGMAKTLKNGKVKLENKNYGVFGVQHLPMKIKEAQEKLKNWSDEQVKAYRFSHGHCAATAY